MMKKMRTGTTKKMMEKIKKMTMVIVMKMDHLQNIQILEEVLDDFLKVMACHICVEGFRRLPWLVSVYYPVWG